MNLKLEIEFSKAPLLQEVDALKKQIDDMRPLPEDVEGRVMQKLRLDWNYNSNAIEGNKLSYGETVAFLMEGITAKGKPLKDHLDIRGHNEAILFLTSLVKDARPISEADIRSLHEMILVEPYKIQTQSPDGLPTTKTITLGEYKKSPNHVKTATGELHYYATPEETPAKMQELMEWYSEVFDNEQIHLVVVAALFHHKFVAIHPFDDGNGRLSRILMNLILMQEGFPPVIVKMDDRQNYYSLLSRADSGDSWPFVEYITERLQSSLQLYLKAARGGDIDEDEDIDKDIALFKMQVQETTYKEKRSIKNITNILLTIMDPLSKELFIKAEKFDDLFNRSTRSINIFYNAVYYEQFSSFNQNMVNFISNRYRSFERIEMQFSFANFKSTKKAFNINAKQTIFFNLYDYSVFDNQNKLIALKKYHEGMSDKEKKTIIRILIEDIKNQINFNLNK